MCFRNQPLTLRSHNCTLNNLDYRRNELAAKIDSGGTDTAGSKSFLNLVFLHAAIRQRNAQGCTPNFDTVQAAFCVLMHIITPLYPKKLKFF